MGELCADIGSQGQISHPPVWPQGVGPMIYNEGREVEGEESYQVVVWALRTKA